MAAPDGPRKPSDSHHNASKLCEEVRPSSPPRLVQPVLFGSREDLGDVFRDYTVDGIRAPYRD
jgi:hypothetical protein